MRFRSATLVGVTAAAAFVGCARNAGVGGTARLPPDAQVLRFARLVDGTGAVLDDAVVVVSGERFVSVGSGDRALLLRGATVIDLRPLVAIPGLIDMHTHMAYWWDRAPGTRPIGGGGTPRTAAELASAAMENARKTLETGVTTVRDLGASRYVDVLMRDRINRGEAVGPRMFVSGYGLSKLTNPPAAGAAPAWLRGRIANLAEIAGAVKTQVDSGADVIKMYGSQGSYQNVSTTQTFTYEEMKAAVDAAHAAGKRIAIHSYGPEGARDAVRAGANTVEHPVDLDDTTLAEMVRRGVIYVPTVDHNRYYAEHRAEYGWTEQQAAALDAFRARNLETVRRAIRAGVKIAMGSDAVYTMFGQNTHELGFFVQAGMTPLQALASATVVGAEALGMSDRLGRVAPGYLADIAAVEGDPTRDIGAVINGVRWVMKGGMVVVDRR